MKHFTSDDVERIDYKDGHYYRLKQSADHDDMEYAPMWFHLKGLQETATGYGRRLNTGYKLSFNGRMYRVYCCIFSNSGTLYIRAKQYDNWLVVA